MFWLRRFRKDIILFIPSGFAWFIRTWLAIALANAKEIQVVAMY
jgi:hypothetical protein